MPEWSALPPLRSTNVWIKRQALFLQFDSLLSGLLGTRNLDPKKYLGTIKVSRRPALEQFALRSGTSIAFATVIGGTESVDAFWIGRITRPSPPYLIHTCEIYVDQARNLYMMESVYDRFRREFSSELSRRMRPVSVDYLYREHLLTKVIMAMAALAVA